jgi:hypothetical protein
MCDQEAETIDHVLVHCQGRSYVLSSGSDGFYKLHYNPMLEVANLYYIIQDLEFQTPMA